MFRHCQCCVDQCNRRQSSSLFETDSLLWSDPTGSWSKTEGAPRSAETKFEAKGFIGSQYAAGLTYDFLQMYILIILLQFVFQVQISRLQCLAEMQPISLKTRVVTDLQSNTDDVECIFNLWMLSPMSQLLAQPDTQTTQSHTPNKAKQTYRVSNPRTH